MSTILTFLPAEDFKNVAGTSGGEWAGPCPWCGGTDRFRCWPEHPSGAVGGRYMCRGCGQKGDGIQFLRDHEGMSYQDACRALQVSPRPLQTNRTAHRSIPWKPKPTMAPAEIWQHQAASFVAECSSNMIPESEGMTYAESRGLTADTVAKLKIGWNTMERFENREAWGLPPEKNANGNPKKVWLPAGFVIPSHRKSGIVALKIRRSAWTPEVNMPKYVAVAGSVPGIALGGASGKPVIVVESEIDAVLVHQEAHGLVGALALGTASGKPDADTFAYLQAAPCILVALDFDEAGIKAFPWWREHFKHSKAWPTPEGKDVGDLASTPGYVRAWIQAAFIGVSKPVLWPTPEPGPIETVTPAGKYACLFAIASVYGAVLIKDALGGFTVTCPSTTPQEAAQAARDGLAELAGYIGGRLT